MQISIRGYIALKHALIQIKRFHEFVSGVIFDDSISVFLLKHIMRLL